jgi:hypothetical protein
MISKYIPANSFYHTCRYICTKEGAEVLLTEGVRGHNYKLMADDFQTQQQLHPSKSQACFHSILSFYPGEKPSDELMTEIAEKYLKELKISDTQYAISKHTDKAHLHLHIVANMVNNKGAAISDSWIGLRGKKIAQRLTKEYNLTPALEKNLKLTNLEALSRPEACKYEIYIAVSENLPHCQTMEELENRLLKLGIEIQYKYKGQTREKQGLSFKKDKVCFKGSDVDRKFSLTGLEKALEFQRKQASKVSHTQKEKLDLTKDFSHQKTPTRQNSHSIISQGRKKDLSDDKGKGLKKTINILLRPEKTNEQIPREFLREAEPRKRRGLSR